MPRPARTILFALAAGYFACYVPYSAIVKALTTAEIRGPHVVTGPMLLPIITLASLGSMVITISALGWWRYAIPAGKHWPRPTRWTALSGVATAFILVTTTLAYTFEGVSIAFVMLVMRGGVLVIAPIVDHVSGRRIRWFSWVALGLSVLSLGDAIVSRSGRVPIACVLDLALYLTGYFVRLRLMAHSGKSDDRDTRRRFFVEEQMIATPVAVVVLALVALVGPTFVAAPLRAGIATLPGEVIALAAIAGVCSQGTGVFGALLLLDASEASYCVPLNRAASILGGLAAATLLAVIYAIAGPGLWEVVGASLLVAAIGVLWIGPQLRRHA